MTRQLAAGLVYVWLVSLPFLAFARVWTWTDERALWASAQWWASEKLRPMVNLGVFDRSPEHFERAIRTYAAGSRPKNVEWAGCALAVENLARVLAERGRYEESIKWSGYRCDGPLSW